MPDIGGNDRCCHSIKNMTDGSSASAALQHAVVTLLRCPLIANPPPLVMDSRNLTLLDLGSRDYLASSDLPPACQVRVGQHADSPYWQILRVMHKGGEHRAQSLHVMTG